MEPLSPPAIDLSPQLYRQLVYTLTDLLPPPLDDSPEALRARNHAAVAKVAALLPVVANEIDLAAHCIAARGQAEEMLRMIRVNAGDIGLAMRLNAQYGSMVRTSLSVHGLSVHGRLMRVQAVRQKREAIEGKAAEDAWTLHVAERSMLKVVDPNAEQRGGRAFARHDDNSVLDPENQNRGSPTADVDNGIETNVSDNEMFSHDVAFETPMSEPPGNQGTSGPGEMGLRKGGRAAMAGWILARSLQRGRELSANGRENLGSAA